MPSKPCEISVDLDPIGPEYEPSAYPCNVTAYLLTKEYGGPEEGGWWWHCYEILESIPVGSREQAEGAAAKLVERHGPRHDPQPLSNVNSAGHIVIQAENPKGALCRPKPHYE